SSRRRHTRCLSDWSSDVCSSDLDITYGTALSSTQLDATPSVPGSFQYTPSPGTVLHAGSGQPLSVSFIPNDTANYTTASVSVYKIGRASCRERGEVSGIA